VGAIKGSARSCRCPSLLLVVRDYLTLYVVVVNATIRPAAGVLGVIAYPIEGAWKTMQCAWDLMEDQQLRATRVSDGLEEVRKSALEEREAVLDKLGVMKMDTEKRHEQWKAQVENAMLESEDQNSPPEGSSSSQAPRTRSVPPATPQSLPSQDSSNPHTPLPPRGKVDDEEAAFEKDIELAKQLSLEGAKREFMSG
jgi:sterol 3beta-glucosyltransferase